MWLLDTELLELKQFESSRTTQDYAILSHTWDKQEITFQQIQEICPEASVQYTGFNKVVRFCALARERRYNFQYAWIDTCCIDKKSSAELDEAIRSMFQWYEKSAICFAFLSDVPPSATRADFRNSKWFKRGWTLQELIAPKKVLFFNNDWKLYGSLEDREVLEDVCKVTRIDEAILKCKDSIHSMLSSVSIARKMSWASRRETTRVEDEAYCLMGLFGVHMPVMYGEGRNAFYRLQKAILETSTDQSIFAWKENLSLSTSTLLRGLLAQSPAEFEDTGHIRPDIAKLPAPHGFDGIGLRFDAVLNFIRSNECNELREIRFSGDAYHLQLACHNEKGHPLGPLIVLLGRRNLGARILPQYLFSKPSTQTPHAMNYVVPIGR